MHDLKMIAVFDRRGFPLRARHDLAIEFNRDTVRFHSQRLDESSERVEIPDLLRLSVDGDGHDSI